MKNSRASNQRVCSAHGQYKTLTGKPTTKDTFVEEILVIRSLYNPVSTAENRMAVSDKSRTWYGAIVAYFRAHVAFALRRTSGTKRAMVVSYRCFETTRRSHLQGVMQSKKNVWKTSVHSYTGMVHTTVPKRR